MPPTPESTSTPPAASTPKPCAIARCQHIKTNGVQCGSPALRTERHCFFHHQHRRRAHEFDVYEPLKSALTLPTLEDANSIQIVLTEVLRLILTRHIDHKSGSLLLRALRLAAANVKFTSFDPKQKTHIIIDPESVENRPLGATAWSETEGRAFDYDNPRTEPVPAPSPTKSAAANRPHQHNSHRSAFTRDEYELPETNRNTNNNHKMDDKSTEFLDELMRLTVGQVIDPNYLDRPYKPADKTPADNPIDPPSPSLSIFCK